MTKFIETIEQITDSSQVKIDLKGKNLIIVGNNGAGKTKFLNLLNISLRKNILEKNLTTREESLRNAAEHLEKLNTMEGNDPQRIPYENTISYYNQEIERLKKCNITYSSFNDLKMKVHGKI